MAFKRHEVEKAKMVRLAEEDDARQMELKLEKDGPNPVGPDELPTRVSGKTPGGLGKVTKSGGKKNG